MRASQKSSLLQQHLFMLDFFKKMNTLHCIILHVVRDTCFQKQNKSVWRVLLRLLVNEA